MIIINTISPYIDIDDHDDDEYEYADNHVDWTFDDNDGAYYDRDDSDDSNIGDDEW